MKSTRLKDVLDDDTKYMNTHEDKFKLLIKRIESHNPNIDNFEYRWVEKKIDDLENGIVLERKDLEKANTIWRRWE